ncbi:MAG TPA: hypothetical protein VG847_01935 [Chitinophagaceae bacterium]|nr:hypothetical protein [Chitinophagaceae bacterium]
MSQLKAKMFLGDQRGCTETEQFRRYCTFNFENYYNENKSAFGNLAVLNDETLAGGYSAEFTTRDSYYVLLLPVAGSLLCNINDSEISLVHPGQMAFLKILKNNHFVLTNSYKSELINFIQVWVKTDDNARRLKPEQFSFDIEERKNELIQITPQPGISVTASIGMFDGRKKAACFSRNMQSSLFAFVISGVFEVEHRLLHAGDGLALWNGINNIEMEALSNNAILFLLELE